MPITSYAMAAVRIAARFLLNNDVDSDLIIESEIDRLRVRQTKVKIFCLMYRYAL